VVTCHGSDSILPGFKPGDTSKKSGILKKLKILVIFKMAARKAEVNVTAIMLTIDIFKNRMILGTYLFKIR
jgi:hypothetical protein